MAMLNYNDRMFHSTAAETTAADGTGVVGHYRQDGDVIWGEFTGGRVARGSLAGTCGADGVIHFAYCQVLTDSSVMAGLCTSIPTVLTDGRIRLEEHWERFAPHAGSGISILEEALPPAPVPAGGG
jgi:hypothetical protein